MEALRRAAETSVTRGCGFAGLAITCVLVAFANQPVALLKAAGLLTSLMAIVLLIQARATLTRDFRKTEVWLMLEPAERPLDAHAQWAGATVLHEVYLKYARITAGISVAAWLLALALSTAFSLLR